MLVQFGAILEPIHFWPRQSCRLAEEGDLSAQHVVKLKVAGFDDFRAILVIVVVHSRLCSLLNRRVYPSRVPTLVASAATCQFPTYPLGDTRTRQG